VVQETEERLVNVVNVIIMSIESNILHEIDFAANRLLIHALCNNAKIGPSFHFANAFVAVF